MTNNQQRRADSLRTLERELKSRDRVEKTKPLGVVAASVLIILAVVGGIWYASSRGQNHEDVQATNSTAPTTEKPTAQEIKKTRTTPLPATVTCEYGAAGEAARPVSAPPTADIPATGTVQLTLNTNQGPIGMELDRAVSPCTVNAIEHLAKNNYYNDTVCHRLTTSGLHVLQCGDPSGSGQGGPGFQFNNEYPTDEMAGSKNPVNYNRGTIAMANAGANTNGSQFFLNYGDSELPPDYTYFGTINESGLATLDKVAAAGVVNGERDGAPAQEVRITDVQVS